MDKSLLPDFPSLILRNEQIRSKKKKQFHVLQKAHNLSLEVINSEFLRDEPRMSKIWYFFEQVFARDLSIL